MKLTGRPLQSAIASTLKSNPRLDAEGVRASILSKATPGTTIDVGEVAAQMEARGRSWDRFSGKDRASASAPYAGGLKRDFSSSPMGMRMGHMKRAETKKRKSRWGEPARGEGVASAPVSKRDAIGGALAGVPTTIARGSEGDVTIHPPGRGRTVPLRDLAGTHESCAPTFDDGRKVEGLKDELVRNPGKVRELELTVFNSTSPHDAGGEPKTWSMNNRRLKAMQLADAELRSRGQALPEVPVKWADASEVDYAVGAGKFNNDAHGPVAFTTVRDKQRRIQRKMAAPERRGGYDASAKAASLEARLKSGDVSAEDMAAMFDL